MAEIDNWIKEQLKKGYKKEQIKEGLRKAGYQQDIIDSVDSFAKKNKQTKQLLIGLTVFLVIVIIVWLVIGNYTAKKEEVGGIQKFIPSSYFSLDHPTTLEELNNFVGVCSGFLGNEKLEDKETALCFLNLNEEFNIYTIAVYHNASWLGVGKYISINVDLNSIIERKFYNISETSYFNICSISEPALHNPLYQEMSPEQSLIFPEGRVFCSELIQLTEPNFVFFTGFVPQAKSFNAELYLVPHEIIPEVLSKESFSEAKNLVESYTLIWQFEKPIDTFINVNNIPLE